MVASGMYEGVDLAQDLGRWQLICQVPYPSLADALTVAKSRINPNGYKRRAIRQLEQASGRISRGPDDFGATVILDEQFAGLYSHTREQFEPWFKEAVYL